MENYNVLMVLGEGSFDRVLLVHNKSTSQKYAMKEIKCPKSVFNIEKTWNESIILAKTIHPNINVFLTQNGKMKLEDFESAVLLKCPMAYICSFVGNPYYTPPEI
ncbi:putative Serine-threonine-protein [Naja naja]|nr:putative Serine-threonine-protein [Naja naja]